MAAPFFARGHSMNSSRSITVKFISFLCAYRNVLNVPPCLSPFQTTSTKSDLSTMYSFLLYMQKSEYLSLTMLTQSAALQIALYRRLSMLRHFKSWLGQGTAISSAMWGKTESFSPIIVSAKSVSAPKAPPEIK